jgi:hypothetical protein
MSRLIDLREHFGIWDRCGNSRFFKKQSPSSMIYLNPLDGVLVSAHKEVVPGSTVRYTLIVRDASKASKEDIEKAYEANSPWVQNAVKQFFYYQAIGWALDAIKEHTGKDPLPGDKDMGNFLTLYQAGGESYRKEGGRDYQQFVWEGSVLKDLGDVPLLEEALEAILRTVSVMKSTVVDYGRGLSEADVEDALAERGILEC